MDGGGEDVEMKLDLAPPELKEASQSLAQACAVVPESDIVPEKPFTFTELPLLVRLSVYEKLPFSDLQSLRLSTPMILDDIDDYIGLIPTLPLGPHIPSNIWEYIRNSYFQNILIKNDCRSDPHLQNPEELLYTPGSVKSLEFSIGSAISLPFATYLLSSCCNITELNFSGMIKGGFIFPCQLPFKFNNLKTLKLDPRGGAWSPSNIGNSGKWFTSQISLLELIECPRVQHVTLNLLTYRAKPISLRILTKSVFNFTRKLRFLENIQISMRQKEGLVHNEEISFQEPENHCDVDLPLSSLLLLNQGKLKNLTLTSSPEGVYNTSSMKLEYLTGEDKKFWRFTPIIPPPEGTTYLTQVSRNLVSLSLSLSIGANSQFSLGAFGHLDNLKHIKIFNSGNIVPSPLLHGLDNFHEPENKIETMIFKNFQITTDDFFFIAKYKNLKHFGTTGKYDFSYGVPTGIHFDCFKTLLDSRGLEALYLPTSVIRTENSGDRVRLRAFKRRHLRSFLDDAETLVIAEKDNEHWWIPPRAGNRATPHVFYH